MKIRKGNTLIESMIIILISQLSSATDALNARLLRMQAGTVSIGDLKDDLALTFDAARDENSCTTLLTGAEQTLYEETPQAICEFHGGFIDLTNLADTRSVTVRVYAKIKAGGAYVKLIEDTHTGALDKPLKLISGFVNCYGYKVTIEQTVEGGGYISVDHEWFNAAPGA